MAITGNKYSPKISLLAHNNLQPFTLVANYAPIKKVRLTGL